MRCFQWFSAVLVLTTFVGCDPGDPVESKEAVVTATAPDRALAEARPAEVGVGLKGQSIRKEEGIGKIIVGPAVALFNTKEKVAFEILIPSAMNLFKGSEGRAPNSHEEFMEKIIKANQIKLPQLPPGQIYKYRVEEEQLWVEPETQQ